MNTTGKDLSASARQANRKVAVVCLFFFVGMLGMAYAAVPLYDMFCRVTGYGGTTQRVTQYSQTVLDRDITVRFDANTSSGLAWDFKPVQRDVVVRIGETTQVAYEATNRASRPSAGRATFNVTPPMAGAYFMKVECFCFTDTELAPGETLDMPVVFYVDPAIVDVPELKNVDAITLSYTFFPLEKDRPQKSAGAGAGGNQSKADTEFGG